MLPRQKRVRSLLRAQQAKQRGSRSGPEQQMPLTEQLPGGPLKALPGGPANALPGGPLKALPGGPLKAPAPVPGGPLKAVPGGPLKALPGGPLKQRQPAAAPGQAPAPVTGGAPVAPAPAPIPAPAPAEFVAKTEQTPAPGPAPQEEAPIEVNAQGSQEDLLNKLEEGNNLGKSEEEIFRDLYGIAQNYGLTANEVDQQLSLPPGTTQLWLDRNNLNLGGQQEAPQDEPFSLKDYVDEMRGYGVTEDQIILRTYGKAKQYGITADQVDQDLGFPPGTTQQWLSENGFELDGVPTEDRGWQGTEGGGEGGGEGMVGQPEGSSPGDESPAPGEPAPLPWEQQEGPTGEDWGNIPDDFPPWLLGNDGKPVYPPNYDGDIAGYWDYLINEVGMDENTAGYHLWAAAWNDGLTAEEVDQLAGFDPGFTESWLEVEGLKLHSESGGDGGDRGPFSPYDLAPQWWDPYTQNLDMNEDLVQGRLEALLEEDSDYLKAAKGTAARQMNSRGLLNSSLASEATAKAAIEAALPIAQQDAAAFMEQSLANQQYLNESGRFNAESMNRMLEQLYGHEYDMDKMRLDHEQTIERMRTEGDIQYELTLLDGNIRLEIADKEFASNMSDNTASAYTTMLEQINGQINNILTNTELGPDAKDEALRLIGANFQENIELLNDLFGFEGDQRVVMTLPPELQPYGEENQAPPPAPENNNAPEPWQINGWNW